MSGNTESLSPQVAFKCVWVSCSHKASCRVWTCSGKCRVVCWQIAGPIRVRPHTCAIPRESCTGTPPSHGLQGRFWSRAQGQLPACPLHSTSTREKVKTSRAATKDKQYGRKGCVMGHGGRSCFCHSEPVTRRRKQPVRSGRSLLGV